MKTTSRRDKEEDLLAWRADHGLRAAPVTKTKAAAALKGMSRQAGRQ